jgi:hypothetical protein
MQSYSGPDRIWEARSRRGSLALSSPRTPFLDNFRFATIRKLTRITRMRRMIGTRWRLKPLPSQFGSSKSQCNGRGSMASWARHSQSLTMWASRLVGADAMEQVVKTWIVAHGIKEGVYFKELQNV